ncbi:MAG TPA: AAA family ATPase [Leptospiraceae bacterium]|nr:AAA family ATPase [Leptospiraceae bacterium]HNN02993.1 AAA family ATPase [Leptospiraceae bacterium]
MKKLDIGNSDFKNIIEGNYYYVDKSLFIQELIDIQKQVVLIPRPRRFGKTLNLSMLRYFFETGKPENEKLFAGLKIEQTGKDILEKRGKYPVIYLTLKDAKGQNWEEVLEHIKSTVVGAYLSHYYLMESELLKDFEKSEFNEILKQTASKSVYEKSLLRLSEYLFRFHHEKVVILIDEYDTTIHSGVKKFYNEAVSFLRNFLSSAFKDNSCLYKGVITGILRVSRESIFSGLNNLSVYSILDRPFSDKFGFTDEELKQIITDLEQPVSYHQIKEWYNGYTFGNRTEIYNPWSVLNYIIGWEDGFKPYWANTSSNDLILDRISRKKDSEMRESVERLLNGETVERELYENFVFSELDSSPDLIWTLLTFSGYLTVQDSRGNNLYKLRIPNYEIKLIFRQMILGWLNAEISIMRNFLQETADCLVNNQIDKFAKGFRKIIGDTFSYFDTDGEPEKVYHAYTLGMLAVLCDDYVIRSNRESGNGRYDILMIPHDKSKNGIVMEIKQIEKKKRESAKKFNERIQKELDSALLQIEENEYYKELIDHRVSNIIKLPIVFAGKEAFFKT